LRYALPSALVYNAFGVFNPTLSYFPRVSLRFTLGFDILHLRRINQPLSYFPRVALRFTLGFDVLRLWRT
jgi:hypothetical protein